MLDAYQGIQIHIADTKYIIAYHQSTGKCSKYMNYMHVFYSNACTNYAMRSY